MNRRISTIIQESMVNVIYVYHLHFKDSGRFDRYLVHIMRVAYNKTKNYLVIIIIIIFLFRFIKYNILICFIRSI